MEFLIEMTTHIPAGMFDDSIEDVRAREAARSRELAAQGTLLRLWRPAGHTSEWRTVGLFTANDSDSLEELLASMPLRVWRTDEVTPLHPHPNDPALVGITANRAQPTEFLIAMTITVSKGIRERVVDDAMSRQAQRGHELARDGHLVRLWDLPGEPDRRRTLGLWRARDAANMVAVLESLPLYGWMTVEILSLTAHPDDPARKRKRR